MQVDRKDARSTALISLKWLNFHWRGLLAGSLGRSFGMFLAGSLGRPLADSLGGPLAGPPEGRIS